MDKVIGKCTLVKHYDNYEIVLGSELDIFNIGEDEVLTNIGFLPLDHVKILSKTPTMDELVSWFQLTFPKMVKEMKNCSHHYDSENLNPYHLESDIFTHTMQVCLMARHASPIVQLSALLHDIGKPLARKPDHERKYTSFIGHESISAFIALDVLKKVDWLTDEEKVQVFRTIAHHTDPFKLTVKQLNELFTNEPELSTLVRDLSICDHLGRFTTKHNEEKEFSYNFKFMHPDSFKTKDLIVLVGLPNSGKSTRTKELVKQGYHVISSDDIIEEMCPGMTYDQAYKAVDHDAVKTEFGNRLMRARKENRVVVDTCNLSKKRRKHLIRTFNSSHNIKCEVMLVAPSVLFERNQERSKIGKHIPDQVYEDMIKGFYAPSISEGFTEIEWKLL